jgi:Signal transduction histidine kinase
MFKELRIRLTLFNLMIIVMLLLLIAFGAFIGSPSNDATAVNQSMLQVALTGEMPEQRINTYRNRQGEFARIELDTSGNIEKIDSQLLLEDTDYTILVQGILKHPDNSGIIQLDNGQEFLYLRIILDQTSGSVIVIEELISTAASLKNFALRITPTLILLLLLVFVASISMTQRALTPIKKAWQRQVEFTADASHELRTPLTIIQTNLECATDDMAETIGENMHWFDNIKTENQRMIKLVNDLLILSRSDNSEYAVLKENFSFDELLCSVVDAMKPVAEQKNISLQHNIHSTLDLYGDKELLHRLVVILIDNAIKYTPDNGTVRVSAECINKSIVLRVTDTGIGMAEQHLKKIFERFYRVNETRSSNIDGSGLGLSLAKWIVEMHNGRISVESNVGKGTEFTVVFYRSLNM